MLTTLACVCVCALLSPPWRLEDLDMSLSLVHALGSAVGSGTFSSSDGSETPFGNAQAKISSAPALTSEAVAALAAQSGPASAVAMTAGGITINLLFDAAAMAAPASFRAGIEQAASILTEAISDLITVNIKIDYSGTG